MTTHHVRYQGGVVATLTEEQAHAHVALRLHNDEENFREEDWSVLPIGEPYGPPAPAAETGPARERWATRPGDVAAAAGGAQTLGTAANWLGSSRAPEREP